jgi:hypothetical protein
VRYHLQNDWDNKFIIIYVIALFENQFLATEKLLCDRTAFDEREATRLVLHGESPVGFLWFTYVTLNAAFAIMTSVLQGKDEVSFTVHCHLLIICATGSIFLTLYTDVALYNRTIHYPSNTFIY